MIALDTNALIRLLTEDEPHQANTVKELVLQAEDHNIRIIIISEVMIETVWVLESVYHCTRDEIVLYLETILSTSIFFFPDFNVISEAIEAFKIGGGFADLVIVGQAQRHQAERLISFDKKLQKRFQGYVTETHSIV